jgi:hypothetical protein
MDLSSILQTYDASLIDQISTDKIDETISLRLPPTVVVQEIVSALGSLSYVSGKITYARPPAFAFLDLLMQSPDYTEPIEGFREKVVGYSKRLSEQAGELESRAADKNYHLYIRILQRAWENDGIIDKAESSLLEVVKTELGIWDREHYVLGYHPSILKLWNINEEYQGVRNFLLTTGLVLMHNQCYVIANEVAMQIRKVFGMEIKIDSYKRLISEFNREDLANALARSRFQSSGSKLELIDRIMDSLIPPSVFLETFHGETLREYCRSHNISVTGTKAVLINNILSFFDHEEDLINDAPTNLILPVKEPRELTSELFEKLLSNLSGQQLYDILYQLELPTSGTKEEKWNRLVSSDWSERAILSRLRKDDLSVLCRRFNASPYGAKQELIDRILDTKFSSDSPEIETKVQSDGAKAEVASTTHKDNSLPSTVVEKVQSIPELPKRFDEVASDFPELTKSEQIVLSIIKEAKSVSEQELEKIVIRYELGWFLLKAKMAEIMARLRKSHKEFLKIKSIQSTNLYQWDENLDKDEIVLEKRAARDIIDALRHGVVPKNNLDLLVVGQQNAREHLERILHELNHSKSQFKFIRGPYGSGKTFFCSWLKEHALRCDCVVSFLNISHEQPLSDLPLFYSGVINGLRTPEKLDSSALVDILEAWLLNVHTRTVAVEDANGPIDADRLEELVERQIELEVAKLNDVESGFSQALRSFYRGKSTGDLELVTNTVAWLNGSRSLSAQALRLIGVKGYLEPNNVFPRMRALLEIILGAGFRGSVLLVDELELVRKFPHARQREQSLETLRLLIDEAGKNALPGCLLVFTGTDEFFEDDRHGLKSYPALADRVLSPGQFRGYVSMKQPIIELETLDAARLTQVITKIMELYCLAYGCNMQDFGGTGIFEELVNNWTRFGDIAVSRKPRPILREFIQMLDICEENKGLTLLALMNENGMVHAPQFSA